jgi:hypothetical protein
MAMMKYGRFSPKTTDPNTGARISDPDVYGQTIKGGGKVSSWPELRTMFQSGKLNEDFFGKGGTKAKPGKDSRYQLFPQDVKNYLEGKTDKLDDVNYEEPILTEDYAEMGSSRKRTFANLNYKVDSPKWKSAIKKATIPGEKYTPSEEGVNRQVDISVKEGYGETYGVSSIRKTKETTPTPPPPNPPKKESTPEVKEPVKPIELKKPGLIKNKKMKTLGDVTVLEEGSWQPPVPSRINVEVDKSREGGAGGKWGLRKKISDGELKSSLRMSVSGGRNKREERMAKAFYSPESELGHGGYYSSMDETEGNISKAIRSDIKDIRQEKRDWKKNTSLTGADKREGAKEFRKDIKTGRLSARYANRGDLHSEGTKVWAEGEKSKLKTWTADIDKKGREGAMSGYVQSAVQNLKSIASMRQAENRNISNANISNYNKRYDKQEQYVKSAEDNATNRNTVEAKMKQYTGWNRFIK